MNKTTKDIFEFRKEHFKDRPLAFRMRPEALSDFVGQTHILGKGKFLQNIIDKDRLVSLILFGPSGTGKSTLAYIISKKTNAKFVKLNAVTSGVSDVRRVIEEAEERLKLSGVKTILFIDEVHRFNRAQQEALLPSVEEGTIIFIGATTENPFFAISSPLISRAALVEFRPLSKEELSLLIDRGLKDKEKGLGKYKIELSNDARETLINLASGDARVLYNILELAFLSTEPEEGIYNIGSQKIKEVAEKRFLRYDRASDYHYDIISAFIKSLRGSDPDAALFWLVRMVESGESPEFIARRMIILASEDIGLANPYALTMAVNASLALERVGLPEAILNLAEVALYLAISPKSNAVYRAVSKVKDALKKGIEDRVPNHLKNAKFKGEKRMGKGVGYKYPHDFPGHYVKQMYTLHGEKFYSPSDNGYEKEIRQILEKLRRDNG